MQISLDTNISPRDFTLGASISALVIYALDTPTACSTALKVAQVAGAIYQALTFLFVAELVFTVIGIAIAVELILPPMNYIFNRMLLNFI